MNPSTCFDRGQRITEIAAALAYAEYHAQRLSPGGRREIQDVSSGVNTAAVMADRLEKETGKDPHRGQIVAFTKNLGNFSKEVRKKASSKALKPAEIKGLRDQMSQFRKEAIGLWSRMKKSCGR